MRDRRGMTVLELLVCAAIMVVVLGVLYWLAGTGGLFVAGQRATVEHFLEATEFFEYFHHDLRNVSRRSVESLGGGRFRIRFHRRPGEGPEGDVDYVFDSEGRKVERISKGGRRVWRFPDDESFAARFVAGVGAAGAGAGGAAGSAGPGGSASGGRSASDPSALLSAGADEGSGDEDGAISSAGSKDAPAGRGDRWLREGAVQIVLGAKTFRFPLVSSEEEGRALDGSARRDELPVVTPDPAPPEGELAGAVVPAAVEGKRPTGARAVEAKGADMDRADRVFEQFIAGGDQVLPRWARPGQARGGRYTIYQPNSNLVDPRNGEPPLMIGLLPGQEAEAGKPSAVIPGLMPGDDAGAAGGTGDAFGGAGSGGEEILRSPQSPLDPSALGGDPWQNGPDTGGFDGVPAADFGGTGPSMGDGFTFDGRSLEEVLNDRITGRFDADQMSRLDTAFRKWADEVGMDPCDQDYIWGQLDDASDWYESESSAASVDGDSSRLAEASEWAAFDSKSVADQLRDRAADQGYTADNLGTGFDAAVAGVGRPAAQPLAPETVVESPAAPGSSGPIFGDGGTMETVSPPASSGFAPAPPPSSGGFGSDFGSGGLDMGSSSGLGSAPPAAPVVESSGME